VDAYALSLAALVLTEPEATVTRIADAVTDIRIRKTKEGDPDEHE